MKKPNIAFFTEGAFNGKVDRTTKNRRTDLCWYAALNSDHHCLWLINQLKEKTTKYDLGIVILPKKLTDESKTFNLIKMFENLSIIRKHCNKVAVMQEGPHWLFQDGSLEEQIWYFNMLHDADFLLCHNEIDVKYYYGLTGKRCYTMPSLMITDGIFPSEEKEDVVMIGGNMCSWYGGFDSYIVAKSMNIDIMCPSMGRRILGEEQLESLKHLPQYIVWTEWMDKLSKCKYAIHLMRTHAAGTFALNCSWLGIPCIGYKGLDTQRLLHSECTIEIGDLDEAKYLATKLKEDKEFYWLCSHRTKHLYKHHYSEEVFMNHMNEIFKKELK